MWQIFASKVKIFSVKVNIKFWRSLLLTINPMLSTYHTFMRFFKLVHAVFTWSYWWKLWHKIEAYLWMSIVLFARSPPFVQPTCHSSKPHLIWSTPSPEPLRKNLDTCSSTCNLCKLLQCKTITFHKNTACTILSAQRCINVYIMSSCRS